MRTAGRRFASTTAAPATSAQPIKVLHSTNNASGAVLGNIEATWTKLPKEEQYEVYRTLEDVQKKDWKQLTVDEKKACEYAEAEMCGWRGKDLCGSRRIDECDGWKDIERVLGGQGDRSAGYGGLSFRHDIRMVGVETRRLVCSVEGEHCEAMEARGSIGGASVGDARMDVGGKGPMPSDCLTCGTESLHRSLAEEEQHHDGSKLQSLYALAAAGYSSFENGTFADIPFRQLTLSHTVLTDLEHPSTPPETRCESSSVRLSPSEPPSPSSPHSGQPHLPLPRR
jgi:hypothetical protein